LSASSPSRANGADAAPPAPWQQPQALSFVERFGSGGEGASSAAAATAAAAASGLADGIALTSSGLARFLQPE
jgi:hypothetical protein